MSLDSTPENVDLLPAEVTADELTSDEVDPALQVRFKTQGKQMLLLLPAEPAHTMTSPWEEVWEQLKHRLAAGERFWQPQTPVYLEARDRLLDARQLQSIADALTEADLNLERVYTSRRQTAVAAATAGYSVEQQPLVNHFTQSSPRLGTPLDDPLYLQSTIRSGMEIRHAGTIVILGDVNPGGSLVAEGDIVVWGRLKGLAYAGAKGNHRCRIMTLHMDPTQLRIADKVARPPETPPAEYLPEVAYIGESGIRIAPAQEFARWLTENQS
ncbi:MAG: septum site-determining protein MinC [Cyanobacteria bacterium P01_D01_bin.6]